MKRILGAYGTVCVISYIIRNLLLPNPFECFGAIGGGYNFLAESIIHALAFFITGLFYERNTFPTIGSILYLVFYCAIIGILWLLGLVKFVWWAILLAVIAIAIIGFAIFVICQTQKEEYN